MGGVEAELIYDPSKVSFVEARLGTSLKTELADIYHNENKSLVNMLLCIRRRRIHMEH